MQYTAISPGVGCCFDEHIKLYWQVRRVKFDAAYVEIIVDRLVLFRRGGQATLFGRAFAFSNLSYKMRRTIN
jgi:hypothetical protein